MNWRFFSSKINGRTPCFQQPSKLVRPQPSKLQVFSSFRGSKLFNGCLVVWPSNLCMQKMQLSKSVRLIFDSLRQYRKWTKEPYIVLFFIRSTSETLKKLYQWLYCSIPSWVTLRRLNLSVGFHSFQFLKFLKLKCYIIKIKLID